MTEAGSPGARRISRKFRQAIARMTSTALPSRRASANSQVTRSAPWTEPAARSLDHIGAVEGLVHADCRRDDVLEFPADEGGELDFKEPIDRHVIGQDLLHLAVCCLPVRIAGRDGCLAEQLVDLGILVTHGVVEQDALLDV